jgi:hypothetical protein
MENIPITFEFEGKQYAGSFQAVFGAGSDTWYLYVDNYYWGRLRLVNGDWFFDNNNKSKGMESMAQYLGEVIIAWRE